MFCYFYQISSEAKVAYFLGLSELIIQKLLDSKHYKVIRTSIDKCWQWLESKEIDADDLFWYLENIDDTGIITLMQSEKDDKKLKVWICIGNALAYTIRLAYEHQGDQYLPATIEGVNEEETFNEFENNFNEITSVDTKRIKSDFLMHLVNYYLKDKKNTIAKQEILKVLN